MTFKIADRVKESCTSPGTGTVTLGGAVTGFQSFSSAIGATNTTYYVIADQSGGNWEIGLGTVGAGGTTLARTTVLASSNGGSLTNFASGSQYIWVDYPSMKAVIQSGTDSVTVPISLIGPIASANLTRFPNALGVASNTAAGIQQNESLYIGFVAEGVSVGTTWGSGLYGVGYTNSTGNGRGTGVTGEAHVSAASDTGVAVGVRGYANDTHTGNYNIGLYGDATNGDAGLTYGGNVALFLANGNIVTSAAAAKLWYLGGNLTFDGQGTAKTIGVTNGAVFALGTPSSGNLANCTFPTLNQNTTGQAGSVAGALTISSPLTGTSYNGSSAVSIGIPAATTSANGYLTSTDWNTFNGKQAALVSGTNIKTINGSSLLGSGNVVTTPAQVSDQANTSTGYFALPVGTTAQRPGSPTSGMTRMNSTTGLPEWYDATGAQWIPYNLNPTQYTIEYLVIAGGAGGAAGRTGGGGGAGGYRTSVIGATSGGGTAAESVLTLNRSTAYTVTVGAGGAIATAGSASAFSTITTVGGGQGADDSSYYVSVGAGFPGGSGGGSRSNQAPGTGGAGTTGQGYRGGNNSTSTLRGTGGGGAGGTGNDVSVSDSGIGGVGLSNSINGTSTYRGGGGAGGSSAGDNPSGGTGGGGNGANSSNTGATAGAVNTGGGGGGGGGSGGAAAGGSGVVIIRYLGAQRGTGGTVTSSGGYTIHTFTSSGTYTA